MDYFLKITISVVPVVVFFVLYYRNFVFERSIFWQSKAFFFGILSSVFAILIQQQLPATDSNYVRSFFHAAVVEEVIRFLIIYVRIRRSSDSFILMEGVFDGILVGLGFAFAENLHYSASSPGYVILLRCVSSVPLHVFCAGIMAYFLSYRHLCSDVQGSSRALNFFSGRRLFLAFWGLVIPVLLHGAFDLALFTGGVANYWIVPMLILGFGFLEFLIADARTVLGKNVLGALGLDADDMDVIAQQRDHEKWLSQIQDTSRDTVPLFVNQWDLSRTIGGIAAILIAVTFTVWRTVQPGFLAAFGIEKHAELALTVLLPLMIALILLLGDKVNYLFIRENMLRVPSSTLLAVFRPHRADERLDTMALDILPRGMFLSGMEDLNHGERVRIEVQRDGGSTASVEARVKWVNRHNRHLPSGALVQFVKPGPGFLLFTVGFRIHRMWRKLRPLSH